MNYLEEYRDNKDVRAETLISLMNIDKVLKIYSRSTFFRNYSGDLTGISKKEAEISRNGIFHILPESLFFEESRIRDIINSEFDEKYKKFINEKKEIKSFFQPFDTEYFNLSLNLEKALKTISEKGNSIFNNIFFSETEKELNNEYIIKIRKLLPYVSQLRGNYPLLINILKEILEVEKIEKRIEKKHSATKCTFLIHKEGLSKTAYFEMDKKLNDFFIFFSEWFLPVEMEHDYRIKDYREKFTLSKMLLLDYNTNL